MTAAAFNSPLPRTEAVLRQGIADGWHLGAQVYVSQRGADIARLALGERRAGDPMTPDTLLLWLSAGKPITAVAVAQLVEAGSLHLDDPIARHLPEFAANGKEAITVRHLLTHTGGFSAAESLPEQPGWEETIAAISAVPADPDSAPGTVAAYQPQAGWYVLAEIVQRITRRPFPEHVRDAVLLPLGMTESWIGMPADRYVAYGPRIGTTHTTFPGPATPHPTWDSLERCTACRPGGNARGPLSDLGHFYEGLLAGGQGVLGAATIQEFTRRHRIGLFDRTFRHIIDFGLGFLVNSRRHGPSTVPYGYGDHAGPDTFGHSGSQSSCAFADPDAGLVVAWMCNGLVGEVRHQRRQRAINTAIYEDLGLKSPP
jgi:CubicO group peptidase (beta-lactamase class C family)